MEQLYDVVAVDSKTKRIIGIIYRSLERERVQAHVRKAELNLDYDNSGEYTIVILEANKSKTGDIIKLK